MKLWTASEVAIAASKATSSEVLVVVGLIVVAPLTRRHSLCPNGTTSVVKTLTVMATSGELPHPPTLTPKSDFSPFTADKSLSAAADLKDSLGAPEEGTLLAALVELLRNHQKDLAKNMSGPTIKPSHVKSKKASSREKSNISKSSSSILKPDVAIPGGSRSPPPPPISRVCAGLLRFA